MCAMALVHALVASLVFRKRDAGRGACVVIWIVPGSKLVIIDTGYTKSLNSVNRKLGKKYTFNFRVCGSPAMGKKKNRANKRTDQAAASSPSTTTSPSTSEDIGPSIQIAEQLDLIKYISFLNSLAIDVLTL